MQTESARSLESEREKITLKIINLKFKIEKNNSIVFTL